MICVECQRTLGDWTAPSTITGRIQGWYRHNEQGPNGMRCADRGACARAADALQPSLFE